MILVFPLRRFALVFLSMASNRIWVLLCWNIRGMDAHNGSLRNKIGEIGLPVLWPATLQAARKARCSPCALKTDAGSLLDGGDLAATAMLWFGMSVALLPWQRPMAVRSEDLPRVRSVNHSSSPRFSLLSG